MTRSTGEIQTIIDAVKGDWSHIDTVSVGNELVNDNAATVPQVVKAVSTARSLLRAANYNGPVVTVDTFIALIHNPELCQASDYAAANAHSFFAGLPAEQAGPYAKEQQQNVQRACNKHTVITESGFPSRGEPNGQAVPSEANQKIAIASLQKAMPGRNLILYTAYDNLWLANTADTFDAEQYWGIYGSA